jgi:Ni,Fe-hydrogenase III small subunit
MRLTRPLTVVLGGRGRIPDSPDGEELLVVGDEAQVLERPPGAAHIPGDPPDPMALHRFYREKGLLCQRCHQLLEPILASLDGDGLKPKLRALAGGEEVFRGEETDRSHTDLTLLVGDCMEHYYGNVMDRSKHILGLDEVPFVAHVPGCPPSGEGVLAGLAQLREVQAQRETAR